MVQPYFPLATLPFSATNAMARMISGLMPWSSEASSQAAPPHTHVPPERHDHDEIAALREEIEALKRAVGRDDASS